MAKKKSGKKKARKSTKKSSRKTKKAGKSEAPHRVSIERVNNALRDAADALNIAERNLEALRKKFRPIVFKKQRRCKITMTD